MNPIQIAKYQQRKKLIIGFGVVFTGLWLLLVFYWLTGNKEPIPTAYITVHAPSPVATGSMPTATFRSSRRATQLNRQTASMPQWSYLPNAPKAMMSSTSVHIHQTSSATVHSIGGAGGNGGGYTTGGHKSGKSTPSITTGFSGAIYLPTAHNAVTEVGARQANEVSTASSALMGSPRRMTMDEFPEYPEDPVPDEIETPIGDVAWGWMLLLTIAWCVRVRLSKRQ